MKRYILLFCLFMASVMVINAQSKPDPNQMIKDRTTYMRNHLKISDKESKAFWPAYEQYLRSEIKLHEAFRLRLANKNIKLNAPGQNKEVLSKLSDSQLTYLQDQKFQLKRDLLNLESTFYKKLKTILSPRHINDFYNIDEQFKRNLMNKKSTSTVKTKAPAIQTKSRR